MEFAKNLLEKQGWKSGQGLGKEEHGIKEAIKVKIKNDTHGVGHDVGEEFTFHWWDHVFNKAANNIKVKNSEDGVKVNQETDFAISKKKPLAKTLSNKEMLYGRFVKASTLNDGTETPDNKDSDSDEDEDQTNIHTSISVLTDEELVKICGGRTAHKGARHGLKMNGKLARIEQQEAAALLNATPNQSDDNRDKESEEVAKKDKKRKKRKKEKENERNKTIENQDDNLVSVVSDDFLSSSKKKKSKKKSKDDENVVKQVEEDIELELPKKHKKKKSKNKSKNETVESENSDTTCVNQECVVEESNVSSKKERKKKRKVEESLVDESDDVSTKVKKKKSKKDKNKD